MSGLPAPPVHLKVGGRVWSLFWLPPAVGTPLQTAYSQSSSLIRVDAEWGPEAGYDLIHQSPGSCFCGLVGHCKDLGPLGELVYRHQDVPVPSIGSWEWPQNINMQPFHWHPGLVGL